MATPFEIYQQLEELLDTFERRGIDELLHPKNILDAEIHENRGRLRAVRELRKIVRSALAYDPDQLK